MRIVSNIDSTLSAYSPVFSIKGDDIDTYEPDDTPDKAKTIIHGSVQEHNFTLNDTDWVKFDALNGVDYIFQCIKDKPVRTNYELYDSAHVQERYSYILSEILKDGDTVIFSWTCKNSGSYYLKTYMADQNTIVQYQLKIIQFDSAQSIEFSEPAAGAIWKTGTINTVSWSPKEENFGALVDIGLHRGGNTVLTASSVPNTGSFSWTIPSNFQNGEDCQMSISKISRVTTKKYYSDAFTITSTVNPGSN